MDRLRSWLQLWEARMERRVGVRRGRRGRGLVSGRGGRGGELTVRAKREEEREL